MTSVHIFIYIFSSRRKATRSSSSDSSSSHSGFQKENSTSPYDEAWNVLITLFKHALHPMDYCNLTHHTQEEPCSFFVADRDVFSGTWWINSSPNHIQTWIYNMTFPHSSAAGFSKSWIQRHLRSTEQKRAFEQPPPLKSLCKCAHMHVLGFCLRNSHIHASLCQFF